MDDEKKLNESIKSRLFGVAAFIALLPIYETFSHFNREGLGFIIVSISAVFIGVVYVNGENLRSLIFVSVLVLFYIAQVVLAFFVKIPDQFPGFVMIPAAFADLFLVLAVMARVERWSHSHSKRGGEKKK